MKRIINIIAATDLARANAHAKASFDTRGGERTFTLIKEDGTGKVDANSYASAADGNAYHDGHLYATAWTAASAGNKEKELVMATRLIDGE